MPTNNTKQISQCWKSQHSLNNYGYAQIKLGKKGYLVHRLIYKFLVGKIPKNLTLDHLCRNRWCINPFHLEVVSRGENVLRGESFSAVNRKKVKCIRGHKFDKISDGRRRCTKCISLNAKNRYEKSRT